MNIQTWAFPRAILRSNFNFASFKFSEYNVVSFFVAVADELSLDNGIYCQLRSE